METIAQEAKRLLEPVPEDLWIEKLYTDGVGKCCAVGHYERMKSSNQNDFSICNCANVESKLINATYRYLFDRNSQGSTVTNVNNGELLSYQQTTSKERVMALLDDMIAAGF